MSSDYVLIFDSGSGGEYVLNICKSLLPSENFVFYKDIHNCPYGNKGYSKLKQIFFSTLHSLCQKYHFKALVLACNTLSSMFGKEVKKSNLFKKVFLITPRINAKIISNNTLFLATTNTCNYSEKLKKYKNNAHLFVLPLATFASDIDRARERNNLDSLQKEIDKKLSPYKELCIKNVVLGCTHYNYITPHIGRALGSVSFYENSVYVANSLKRYLSRSNLLGQNGEVIMMDKI